MRIIRFKDKVMKTALTLNLKVSQRDVNSVSYLNGGSLYHTSINKHQNK